VVRQGLRILRMDQEGGLVALVFHGHAALAI
jgi:hypothetical protein